MNTKSLLYSRIKRFLLITSLVLLILYLGFHGLAMAKGVLAPIFLAVTLAMMLVPVCNFLEKKGISRGWAFFFADLIFVFLILGILWAISTELQQILGNWSSVQERLTSTISKAKSFIESNTGISIDQAFPKEGEQSKQGQQGGGSGIFENLPVKDWLVTALQKILNSLATIFLVVIYIFFMLLYRDKFEKGVLKFVPDERQEEGSKILSEIVNDAQQYLIGRFILICILAGIYYTGFALSGMKSAFTTALLASFLSIVPYIGVLIGELLALAVAFITTGSTNAVLIVFTTLVVAQFIESYIIEPFLIGKRIDINPLFTILSIVIGGAVWGVIGMIVFLPLFSFIKAVADHVPLLHPLGYIIGKEDTAEGEGIISKLKKKIKNWFQ